jgi:hypothetical protein
MRPDLANIVTGNATQWWGEAASHNVPEGHAPVVGAVAVWTGTTS